MKKIKCVTDTEAAVPATSFFSACASSFSSSFSPAFSSRLRQRFPEAFGSTPPMLPGIVLPQFVRCGKPGCRCIGGDLHGPYFYHYRRDNQRAIKRYLRKEEVLAVTALCRQHQQARAKRLSERRQWEAAFREIKGHLRDTDKMMSEYMRDNG